MTTRVNVMMKFIYKVFLDSLNQASSRRLAPYDNQSEIPKEPRSNFSGSVLNALKAWLRRRKFRNHARFLLQRDDELLVDVDIPRGELMWALSLPVQIDAEKVLSERREQRLSERWIGNSERSSSKHESNHHCN